VVVGTQTKALDTNLEIPMLLINLIPSTQTNDFP